jgi:hypothetical protein
MADINLAKSGNIPALALNRPSSQSWTTTGNTHTITNAHIASDSLILVFWTSAGGSVHYVTPSDGSAVITAANSVASGTTFKYLIL